MGSRGRYLGVDEDLDRGCQRGCPDGECYCSEPSYGDQAYTGICSGCGGYEECYCGEE